MFTDKHSLEEMFKGPTTWKYQRIYYYYFF